MVFASSASFAFIPNAKTPICLDGHDELSVDNARALRFKTEQKNGALTRAYISGKVISAPSKQNDHDHFAISIGSGSTDTVEVIYNKEFGGMPDVQAGDDIIVCGDFINSFARTGHYQPSPEGAIIHWVHFNPGERANSMDHAHGFILLGKDLVGFDEAPTKAWDGTIVPTGGLQSRGMPKKGSRSFSGSGESDSE